MPISIPTIKSEIIAMLNATSGLELEAAKEKFATDMAVVVYNAIKSATVTIPSGSIVTVGSPTTQSNPLPVTGVLS